MLLQLAYSQRSILEPACAREDRCIYPVTALPRSRACRVG